MADDKDLKQTLREALDEGYSGGASGSIKHLAQISADIKKNAQSSEAALKYVEANKTISELSFRQSNEETSILQSALESVADKLSQPNQTDQQIKNRLVELSMLQEKANTMAETLNNNIASDSTISGLERITMALEEQTKTIDSSASSIQIAKSISDLEGLMGYKADETTAMLRDTFESVNADLKEAVENGDQSGIELARAQLDAINSGVQSEEKRREALKLQEESNSMLSQMAAGMENLGKGFDNIAKGVLGGGGALLGVLGIALALFDSEKFQKMFGAALTSLAQVFQGIIKLFTGDVEGGMALLGDNVLAVSGIILGLALQFGGGIITKLGAVFTGIKAVMTGLKVFQVFMMTSFFPAIAGMFSTMIASLTPILVAAAPFIAIGAAIGLALYGLYELLNYVREQLNVGSIGDVLKIGVAYLQDGIGHVANFFIDMVNGLMQFVKDKGGKLLEFLGIDFDIPTVNIDRVGTNNAETVTKKLQQKKIEDDIAEAKKPKLEVPVVNDGAQLDMGSMEITAGNAALQSRTVSDTILSTNNSSSNSAVTNTTIVQAPSSYAHQFINSAFAR
tara:strand:+ start:191 stop:1897 length:1707 start_codon:yes stop_codon:yes gene_type:complete